MCSALWAGDIAGGEPILFNLWPEQERVVRESWESRKSVYHKARQLGMTWLLLSKYLFRSLYWYNREHRVININEIRAKENLERVKWLWENMPVWAKCDLSISNASTIQFRETGSIIRALPCTKYAGRGDTLD